MPYTIQSEHSQCPASRPWAVVKQADGHVMGCHDTKQNAIDQIVAIQHNENNSQ